MAVASSLASTLSLLPLRQSAAFSTSKPSFLSFSIPARAVPSLSIRLSNRRLFASKDDSVSSEDEFVEDDEEEEEGSEVEETSDEVEEEDPDSVWNEEEDEAGWVGDEDEFDEIEASESAIEVAAVEEAPKKSASVKVTKPKKPNKYQIRIKLKSYYVPLLEDTCKQILEAARTTNAKTNGPIFLPTKKRIYCVLTSPHKYKDARDHFEIRTHRRLIDIMQPTAETVESLMQLNFPAGVDVKLKI